MNSIGCLIPELQTACQALMDLADRAGVQPRLTSTCRTHSEQARLYRRYLTGNSPYPAAPPGSSAHEFGYAFDLIVTGDDNQNDLGSVWESWGGVWGGRNRDPIHFEYPGFSPPRVGVSGQWSTAPPPEEGGAIYKLLDFASGFLPYLGEAQLVDSMYRLFAGDPTRPEFYLQHPAEFLRDIAQNVLLGNPTP